MVLLKDFFSKIRINCTVSSEDRLRIPCKLKQTDSNTFSLKISSAKRSQSEEEEKPKRLEVIQAREEKPCKKKAKKAKKGKKSKAIVRSHVKGQCEKVEEGDVIMCKMRGYAIWPAFVTGIVGNSVAIEFFGDHTTHKTTMKNLFHFHESYSDIVSNMNRLRTPMYIKAVREAEGVLAIPAENSIFTKNNFNNRLMNV